MNGFQLLSALRRGPWLIDPTYVALHESLIIQLIEGKLNSKFNDGSQEDRIASAKASTKSNVGIIPVTGPLFKYDGLCGEPGYQTYGAMHDQFAGDDSIDIIAYVIDSPGGQGAGLRAFAQKIRNCQKPTLAWVNDSCQSAAYWIASQCDQIVASQETDMIGSIGAYSILINYLKASEAEGVPLIEIYSSLSEEKNLPVREALKGNIEPYQKELDFLVGFFHADVKDGRSNRLNAKAGDPFKGASYYQPDALKLGLIDAIGGLDFAIDLTLSNKKSTKKSRNMNTKNLVSLATAQPDKVADIIELANGDLKTEGIENAILVESSFLDEAEKVTTELNGTKGKVTQLEAELNTAKTSLTEAQGKLTTTETELSTAKADLQKKADELTAAQARVTELESKLPGGNGKKPIDTGANDGESKRVEDMDALELKAHRLQELNAKKAKMNFSLD